MRAVETVGPGGQFVEIETPPSGGLEIHEVTVLGVLGPGCNRRTMTARSATDLVGFVGARARVEGELSEPYVSVDRLAAFERA